MDKLYIVIPAYNEQETIEDIVRKWYPNVLLGGEGSKLLVIDDGSRDDTGAKLDALKAEFPLLADKVFYFHFYTLSVIKFASCRQFTPFRV